MKKTGKEVSCPICGKMFYVPLWLSRRGQGKRCSSGCYGVSKRGKPTWNKGLKGVIKKNSGSFCPSEWSWKGTLGEYKSLHYRVGTKFGKPTMCESCGCSSAGKNMHWANKSGSYLEIRDDWVRLCSRCHYKFDKHYERRKKYQDKTWSVVLS